MNANSPFFCVRFVVEFSTPKRQSRVRPGADHELAQPTSHFLSARAVSACAARPPGWGKCLSYDKQWLAWASEDKLAGLFSESWSVRGRPANPSVMAIYMQHITLGRPTAQLAIHFKALNEAVWQRAEEDSDEGQNADLQLQRP